MPKELAAVTLVAAALATALPSPAAAAPESYTVDPYHSFPFF